MRVVCDNCGAVYKVPDDKLTKPVNKATCRNCSHRMLIPRPSGASGFEQEERTLIRRTPFGREGSAPGRHTRPIELDEPEETLPRVIGSGRSNRRSAPNAFANAPQNRMESDEYTQWVQNNPKAADEPATVVGPRPGASQPPPAPRSTPAVARPSDFVQSDMKALFGSIVVSLVGVAVLAAVSDKFGVAGIGLRSIGLFFAAGGAVAALLLILTGRFGRFPSRKALSFLIAGPVGAFIALVLGATHAAVSWDTLNSPQDVSYGAGSTLAQIEIVPDSETPEPTPASTPAPTEAPEPAVPVPSAAPTPSPVTTPSPRPTPSPSPAPVRPSPSPSPAPVVVTPRPTPRPTPAPAPAPRPAPAPAPAPAPTTTASAVPMQVLDLLLRNNLDVKRCFFSYMQSNGELPSRVDVRFTLQPTGRATGIGVTQGEFAGGSLDSCLAGAIGGIEFPESSGSASRITYPYIFQ